MDWKDVFVIFTRSVAHVWRRLTCGQQVQSRFQTAPTPVFGSSQRPPLNGEGCVVRQRHRRGGGGGTRLRKQGVWRSEKGREKATARYVETKGRGSAQVDGRPQQESTILLSAFHGLYTIATSHSRSRRPCPAPHSACVELPPIERAPGLVALLCRLEKHCYTLTATVIHSCSP